MPKHVHHRYRGWHLPDERDEVPMRVLDERRYRAEGVEGTGGGPGYGQVRRARRDALRVAGSSVPRITAEAQQRQSAGATRRPPVRATEPTMMRGLGPVAR